MANTIVYKFGGASIKDSQALFNLADLLRARMRPNLLIVVSAMGKTTNRGEINFSHLTHQTVQMDEMAAIILDDKKPIVAVDGNEGWKDMKIIDAIYEAVKTGKKVMLY